MNPSIKATFYEVHAYIFTLALTRISDWLWHQSVFCRQLPLIRYMRTRYPGSEDCGPLKPILEALQNLHHRRTNNWHPPWGRQIFCKEQERS